MNPRIKQIFLIVAILGFGGVVWYCGGDAHLKSRAKPESKERTAAVSRLKFAYLQYQNDHGIVDLTLEELLNLLSPEDATEIKEQLVVYHFSNFGITVITKFDDKFKVLFYDGTIDVFLMDKLQDYLIKHPKAKIYKNRLQRDS